MAARADESAVPGSVEVTEDDRLVVSAQGLGLRFGERILWEDLSFTLASGQLLAVLGPNGTGKTSLIRILLGLLTPSAGHVEIEGRPPREERRRIGYVPQQRVFDRQLALRGRDLVRLGVDGHRWGAGRLSHADRARIAQVLDDVGAAEYADAPIGRLSGGEQQRLRIAQALVSDPSLLLVDEPLLSLDLAYQQTITHLLDERRRSAGTPIIFVTHDVNPVLPMVDRVLYLAPGRWAIGTPDEVLTSESLSSLYDTDVDVLRVRGRIVVVGTPDDSHVHHVGH
jgi:zinc/manganese transport system ATP-binding protein